MMQYLCESCEWKDKRIHELEQALKSICTTPPDLLALIQAIAKAESLLNK
jgi:flagellar basal body P-ring protein FlgI